MFGLQQASESLHPYLIWQPVPRLHPVAYGHNTHAHHARYWALARCGHHDFADGRSARHRNTCLSTPCRFCSLGCDSLEHALLQCPVHTLARNRWHQHSRGGRCLSCHILFSTDNAVNTARDLDSAACRCGAHLDSLGDHRAACPRAGLLRSRGVPLERAAARVCREAGATVAAIVLLRDLNVIAQRHDDRRLEVIANGLPVWGGVQLAVDTTLVSALDASGRPRRHQRRTLGAALRIARLAKERTYPELIRAQRCRLVVLAIEVAGRWSSEAVEFVRLLARSRARSAPAHLRASCASANPVWPAGRELWTRAPHKDRVDWAQKGATKKKKTISFLSAMCAKQLLLARYDYWQRVTSEFCNDLSGPTVERSSLYIHTVFHLLLRRLGSLE